MLDIQLYADRLRQMEEGAKASEFAKLLWRPKEGLQQVRLVPYKFDPAHSIIELQFYYKLAGGNYLAPCTFGKPDPIIDLIKKLRSSGSDAEKQIAKDLSPVSRYYAPVIVRKEEELGVRFWGFGVQVWKQIISLVTNKNWGDITSFTDGNDLDVEFHKIGQKKNARGEALPETKIIPIPQKTPVVDPSRKDLMEKLKEQTDILTIFPLKSYDELKAIVEKYLNPGNEQSTSASSTPAPQTPTVTPAAVISDNKEAVANEFAKFFDESK